MLASHIKNTSHSNKSMTLKGKRATVHTFKARGKKHEQPTYNVPGDNN